MCKPKTDGESRRNLLTNPAKMTIRGSREKTVGRPSNNHDHDRTSNVLIIITEPLQYMCIPHLSRTASRYGNRPHVHLQAALFNTMRPLRSWSRAAAHSLTHRLELLPPLLLSCRQHCVPYPPFAFFPIGGLGRSSGRRRGYRDVLQACSDCRGPGTPFRLCPDLGVGTAIPSGRSSDGQSN
jgi:hypothetical protein